MPSAKLCPRRGNRLHSWHSCLNKSHSGRVTHPTSFDPRFLDQLLALPILHGTKSEASFSYVHVRSKCFPRLCTLPYLICVDLEDLLNKATPRPCSVTRLLLIPLKMNCLWVQWKPQQISTKQIQSKDPSTSNQGYTPQAKGGLSIKSSGGG